MKQILSFFEETADQRLGASPNISGEAGSFLEKSVRKTTPLHTFLQNLKKFSYHVDCCQSLARETLATKSTRFFEDFAYLYLKVGSAAPERSNSHQSRLVQQVASKADMPLLERTSYPYCKFDSHSDPGIVVPKSTQSPLG